MKAITGPTSGSNKLSAHFCFLLSLALVSLVDIQLTISLYSVNNSPAEVELIDLLISFYLIQPFIDNLIEIGKFSWRVV